MNDFPYDALETRAPAAREAALMASLPAQVARAQVHCPAWAQVLRDVNAAAAGLRSHACP
jgi:phenylacetate-CoA ligase